MWTKLFFDRSKRDPAKLRALVAEYASWPLWKKCAALAGVAVAAVSFLLHPYLVGHLTLGSEHLGFSRTIIPSEEPILFVVVVTILEAVFAFMFYALKAFFFPDRFGRDQ